MSFTVTESYQAPAGVYDVRFGRFSSRDDDGPIVKATDFGMRVYMNFTIQSGEDAGEDVPCSCDPEDGLAAWCFIFSGEPPRSTELSEIEKQMQTEKTIKVRVNENGWARGVFVPKNTYLAKFVRFTVRDEDSGLPRPVEKEYQNETRPMVYWQFEVAAGELTGVRIPGSCRYAIKRDGDDLEMSNRSSLFSWLSACGVDFTNLPTFADLDNTLPEFEEVMQRANVLLSVQVGDNGWVSGGQAAIGPAPAGVSVTTEPSSESKDSPPEAKKTAPRKKASAGKKGATKEQLLEAIARKAKELGLEQAVDGGGLTEAGKKFASQHIAPVCDARDIPRSFAKMSPAQVRELIGVVEAVSDEGDEF